MGWMRGACSITRFACMCMYLSVLSGCGKGVGVDARDDLPGVCEILDFWVRCITPLEFCEGGMDGEAVELREREREREIGARARMGVWVRVGCSWAAGTGALVLLCQIGGQGKGYEEAVRVVLVRERKRP
ncbi:hypothetical protein M011DRAFT_340557 [Sporormia fimetaria CBS 119925]|uniref:Uncharacterized protein n=1 Tax=Sporormia fimetaria CBS 119925 TaxID=1340428 RepID=A0A6A6VIE8_9PLEO|nr:hypothetical protein M011DRAFT_340557 [Sporormia fimetaria CBS 119925]